jgi:hypothetical protein
MINRPSGTETRKASHARRPLALRANRFVVVEAYVSMIFTAARWSPPTNVGELLPRFIAGG